MWVSTFILQVHAPFGEACLLLSRAALGLSLIHILDIYMDGMTGVEAVQKIREMDEAIPIAFTTTSTEHTLESCLLYTSRCV